MKHIQGPVGTFDFNIYTEEEYQRMQAEDDHAADVIAAWQFSDEIAYRTDLECSYPQDVYARAATDWLNSQGL
jgi:hypothetical protein